MDDVNVGSENHSEHDSNLLSKIRQYQNSIIKHSELGNDAKILSYIRKLFDMPVTVAHLQETGIGRTINSLRKYSGDVGSASKAIVYKWKDMVAREEEQQNSPRSPSSPESPEVPSESKRKVNSEHKHIPEDKHSKKHSNDKHSKRSEPSSEKSSKYKSDDSSINRSKSHHKREEKHDSHKSSHSKERDHKKSSSDHTRREDRDKSRHDKKRKHEDEPTLSKKKKYDTNDSDSDESNRLLIQENSIDSLSQSDDNILPDSTTNNDDYRENTQSPDIEEPKTSSSNHKKYKSDKHRSSERDSDKKHVHHSNSSSSKKSSHRDKHSSDLKKEKPTSSKSSSSSSLESKDSKSNSSKKPKPEKVKKLLTTDNGIDSGSGASFAEALGMMEPPAKNKSVFKKKSSHSSSPTPSTSSTPKPSKPSKPSTQSSNNQSPSTSLLSSNVKLEPLELNLVSQLPEITTNYKPLTHYNYDIPGSNVRNMTEDEALSVVITSKTQRTKVFSGNKTNWGFVPTLFQLCVRVLQDNIDALEYTGGVPYVILKPVLERATANQLLNTEYHNPYLIEESDELWEKHCKRECRGSQRQELESWRDMYLRCRDERDAKLKALTVNIKQSIDKSLPVRQTKLAYVDNYVKPPRSVARKQMKYGTDVKTKPLITPSSRLNSIAASGSTENRVSVPNPGARAVSSSSVSSIKPKKAPLMQKTLALMKGTRFGRR